LLATDDIVVSRAGSVGASIRVISPPPAVFASYLIRLRAMVIEPSYVSWYLRTSDYWSQIRDAAAGIALANVNAKKLAAISLPLAPLNEQRRIVAAIEEHLSRLDAAGSSLAPALQRIDALRSGLITSLVERPGSPRRRWKEVGHSQNGRAFPSRDYSDAGIRLLRPGNLDVSGRIEWNGTNTRLLPERYADEYPRFIVDEGEIVMNLTAQSLKDEFLGRVCITGPGERCLLNQRIARLTPVEAEPRFVVYALKSRRFREFVNSLNTGSLIQHMFTSQLDEYEIPFPPLEEQRRIVAEVEERLSAIEALRAAIERAQRRSAALRRAVLERAFRGELVPQDPSDEPAEALLARIRATRTDKETVTRGGK
jgi:type I restriction enzyme S subunit